MLNELAETMPKPWGIDFGKKKYPRGDRPSPGAFVSTDNQYLDANIQGNSRA
jgi:hypothetical protein